MSEFPADASDYPLLPARNLPDALTSLIFLDASDIYYNNQITDPWFAATTPLYDYAALTGDDFIPETQRIYTANEPAGVLACRTETFVCNPTIDNESNRCINAYDKSGLAPALSSIWPKTQDRAAVQGALRFLETGDAFNADVFYGTANLPTLITQYSLSGAQQNDPLPANRWQDEMEYGFQASLASLQAAMVETATGGRLWEQAPTEVNQTLKGACEPYAACRSVCDRQMIKSPGHYSFSLLGVLIIICVGGFLILVGMGIGWIVHGYERFKLRGGKSYASIEWQTGSALQMQRLAHEALGLGAWTRTDGDIPVTEGGDMLGVLDVSDHKHARLRHPGAVGVSWQQTSQGEYGKGNQPRLETKELT